jgi:hypothetical protein
VLIFSNRQNPTTNFRPWRAGWVKSARVLYYAAGTGAAHSLARRGRGAANGDKAREHGEHGEDPPFDVPEHHGIRAILFSCFLAQKRAPRPKPGYGVRGRRLRRVEPDRHPLAIAPSI